MPANVRSLEAIHAVRAALASFRDELEQALAMIDMEMRRVLDWLEHDRPRFWRTQVRNANDSVTEARAALHRCLMYPINDERPSCYEERAELQKAEARLAYCDEKSERLRHWIREVRHEMFEYEGRISQLRDLVEIDTPQAMAILDRLLARLDEYQSIRLPTDGPAAFDGLAASAASNQSFAVELMPDPTTPPSAQVAAPTTPPPASPAEEAS
jgi:exonuclease VII large subunit